MKTSAKQIGYYYLMLLTILLIISELVFRYMAESEIEETLVKVAIVSIPLIFVFLGYKWAKWIASIILILNGSISIVGAFELESQSLYIVGLFNIFFGFVLHTSKKIKLVFETIDELSIDDNSIMASHSIDSLEYPYLVTRYKAALIDGLLLFILMAIIMIVTENPENRPFSFVIYLIISILYEPIMLAAYAGTIGHKTMKIRVKAIGNVSKNINLVQGMVRILGKIVFGWLSFLIINFNPEYRAIHDYLSSSIVLKAK